MNLSPAERAQAWGLGTLRLCTPQQSQSISASTRRGWARGSLAQTPQSPGTCPRSRHQGCRRAGPQPGCASGAPSLCTKTAREMPAGTLEKVGGSGPARTGQEKEGRRGFGSTCCGSPGRPRLAPRRDHRGDWQDEGGQEPWCRQAQASSSAWWPSCLGFPLGGRRGGGGGGDPECPRA